MKRNDIYLAFYNKEKDMENFISNLVENGLIYEVEGQYIHLITGHTVVMFSEKDNFNSVKAFKFKTIVIISNISEKQKRRIKKVADLIWNSEKEFLGSEFSFINNQNELSRIIYEIDNNL